MRAPLGELVAIISPWPFSKWKIDLIGPMHTGRGGTKFAIVAVDYFTKWAEIEPLSKITEHETIDFIWTSIIYGFGIIYSIFIDNRKQFENICLRTFCEELNIQKHFSIQITPS